MHSDFLNPLAPRPIIVGLSLGATRPFRLQRKEGAGSEALGGGSAAATTTVDVPMPHNSMVVMLDDCQEMWKHGVPKLANSSILNHEEVGSVRISLTFRMNRPEMAGRHPNCKCGKEAKLKVCFQPKVKI